MELRPTVSIIIIGDEILKGQTQDTNSFFLCKELYKSGIEVCSICVLPDDIDKISKKVFSHSEKYTFVFTSGGIGPTHDDLTYEAVAKSFDEKLVLNKQLQNIMIGVCSNIGLDDSAAFKMSHVPESSEIHLTYDTQKNIFLPVISVKNVFIFPGIPSYLEYTFKQLKHLFCSDSKKYHTKILYLDANESEITDILNAAVEEYKNIVRFGSYPDIQDNYYQVKLVLEADIEEAVIDAEAYLRSCLPHNVVCGPFPPRSEKALEHFVNTYKMKSDTYSVVKALQTSVKVLEDCFKKYSIDSVCLSFNGGKDCTALLHLTHLFLANWYQAGIEKLKIFYVRSYQSFPEVEDFIQLCVQRYNLSIVTYDPPIIEALSQLRKDHPRIQAVLLGSRETDPHCSDLKSFQATDNGWPSFMRISPLIDWSYTDIWNFLKHFEVPYCSLYDKGFTSLGCKNNTVPNPQLISHKKDGSIYYLPAYLLKEPKQERNGRVVG